MTQYVQFEDENGRVYDAGEVTKVSEDGKTLYIQRGKLQRIHTSYGANIFIHPTACVDGGIIGIEDGTRIWHYTHVMAGARIGKNCVIGQGCFVASTAVIGNGCHIQNNVSIYDGVTLEDNVFVGPSVVFTNVKYPRAYRKAVEYLPTVVKRGATIGANATIVCGVTIGECAIIGAGAVITRDVESYTIMCGPAALMMGKVKD